MKKALRLAKKGLGRTSPNPVVGAVIVRDGKIVASGYHKKAGGAHAEVEALADLEGEAGVRDVLYVTLEPCNHYGRTPPCTEAILQRGIKRVVVGMMDPNPDVTGGGCDFLAQRGVEIKTGVLESECRRLNEVFIKHATTGLPFVTAKSALTLDGWTATGTGHSRWVTNERSRRFVHHLRDRMDGLMVGIGTVLADDPSLTTRLGRGKGRDPARIIVDTRLRVPDNARVMTHDSAAPTILAVGEGADAERIEILKKNGIIPLICPVKRGRIDLAALLAELGRMSMTSIMVEGGGILMGSMIREGLVDKFYLFLAPKLLGGDDGIPMASGPGSERMDQCLNLKDVRVRRFGNDILVRGYPDVHGTG